MPKKTNTDHHTQHDVVHPHGKIACSCSCMEWWSELVKWCGEAKSESKTNEYWEDLIEMASQSAFLWEEMENEGDPEVEDMYYASLEDLTKLIEKILPLVEWKNDFNPLNYTASRQKFLYIAADVCKDTPM